MPRSLTSLRPPALPHCILAREPARDTSPRDPWAKCCQQTSPALPSTHIQNWPFLTTSVTTHLGLSHRFSYLEYCLLISFSVCPSPPTVCCLCSSRNELLPPLSFPSLPREKPTLNQGHSPYAVWHPCPSCPVSLSPSSLPQVPFPTISSCPPVHPRHTPAWPL